MEKNFTTDERDRLRRQLLESFIDLLSDRVLNNILDARNNRNAAYFATTFYLVPNGSFIMLDDITEPFNNDDVDRMLLAENGHFPAIQAVVRRTDLTGKPGKDE